MRILFFAIAACLACQQAYALDERSASRIVRDYSETIACQLGDTSYRAHAIRKGDDDLSGLGSIYVVHWRGDVNCYGGAGTVSDQFTVVEQRDMRTSTPTIVTDLEFPDLEFAAQEERSSVTDIKVDENGTLTIAGFKYGDSDRQNDPRQRVIYRIGFDGSKFYLHR